MLGITLTACSIKSEDVSTKETRKAASEDKTDESELMNGPSIQYHSQVSCVVEDNITDDYMVVAVVNPEEMAGNIELDQDTIESCLGDFEAGDRIMVSLDSSIDFINVNNDSVTGNGRFKYMPQAGDQIFIEYNISDNELKKTDGVYDMRKEDTEILIQKYVNEVEGKVQETEKRTIGERQYNVAKIKVAEDTTVIKKNDVITVVYEFLDNDNKMFEASDNNLKIEKGDTVHFDYSPYELRDYDEKKANGEELILSPTYLCIGSAK